MGRKNDIVLLTFIQLPFSPATTVKPNRFSHELSGHQPGHQQHLQQDSVASIGCHEGRNWYLLVAVHMADGFFMIFPADSLALSMGEVLCKATYFLSAPDIPKPGKLHWPYVSDDSENFESYFGAVWHILVPRHPWLDCCKTSPDFGHNPLNKSTIYSHLWMIFPWKMPGIFILAWPLALPC